MIQTRTESASLVKRGHSTSNVTIKTYTSPLPHHATWGNTQNHDHKLLVLSKVILEHIGISIVAWIDIQHILPWCLDPLCWHRDELEDKRLDAACCFESELLCVKPLHDKFIEVSYECRKQKKYRVLAHEGFCRFCLCRMCTKYYPGSVPLWLWESCRHYMCEVSGETRDGASDEKWQPLCMSRHRNKCS